jgi:alkaline phosphatase
MKAGFGRREMFLGAGALAGFGGALELLQGAQRSGARPKNIIFMVADGMSPSVLPLAQQFSLRVRGKDLLWQSLLNRPGVARGSMDMASLDSIVTDSSSASSSWGSGSRIFNGWINMLPDNTKLTPIADIARDKRKRVGLVTTTTVTHATPAGFAAVIRNRDNEAGIAPQYIRNVDVLLGGGSRFFTPDTRQDHVDLIAAYRAQGYGVALNKGELSRLAAPRMLGLFAKGHLPFTIDARRNAETSAAVPTLAEMTQAALNSLSQSSNGFLLQVEGGRVDHGAHANDAAAMLWEQISFDEAIGVVLKFAEKSPETLIVITSDHGNANPGLDGMGIEYTQSDACFERLAGVKSSFYDVSPRLGGQSEYTMSAEKPQKSGSKPTAAHILEVAQEHFGFGLSDFEVEALQDALAGGRRLSVNRQFNSLSGLLGQILCNHTGIGWTGGSHTSDYTIVTAMGPWSEKFSGLIRNTDVFPTLTAAIESNFRNPSMTREQARQFERKEAAAIELPDRPHWA